MVFLEHYVWPAYMLNNYTVKATDCGPEVCTYPRHLGNSRNTDRTANYQSNWYWNYQSTIPNNSDAWEHNGLVIVAARGANEYLRLAALVMLNL